MRWLTGERSGGKVTEVCLIQTQVNCERREVNWKHAEFYDRSGINERWKHELTGCPSGNANVVVHFITLHCYFLVVGFKEGTEPMVFNECARIECECIGSDVKGRDKLLNGVECNLLL